MPTEAALPSCLRLDTCVVANGEAGTMCCDTSHNSLDPADPPNHSCGVAGLCSPQGKTSFRRPGTMVSADVFINSNTAVQDGRVVHGCASIL